MTKKDDNYTNPELRTEIKEKVQAADKGGQSGQWSARKAQMMASEYKRAMHERGEEPYKTDKSEQSDNQKHLTRWGGEKWQTSDGSGDAKQTDGTERRYLPKKAWDKLTEDERRETNERKVKGSKEGKQFVSNTDAAKSARKAAQKEDGTDHLYSDGEYAEVSDTADEGVKGADQPKKRGIKHNRSKERGEDLDGYDTDSTEAASDEVPAAKKAKRNDGEKITTRSHAKSDSNESPDHSQHHSRNAEGTKSKEDEKSNSTAGQPGSATRLPNEGQEVHWKANTGWCEGTVEEILHSEKVVNGIRAKASKNDPRIVLKSSKSGKTATHKPEAVYF